MADTKIRFAVVQKLHMLDGHVIASVVTIFEEEENAKRFAENSSNIIISRMTEEVKEVVGMFGIAGFKFEVREMEVNDAGRIITGVSMPRRLVS